MRKSMCDKRFLVEELAKALEYEKGIYPNVDRKIEDASRGFMKTLDSVVVNSESEVRMICERYFNFINKGFYGHNVDMPGQFIGGELRVCLDEECRKEGGYVGKVKECLRKQDVSPALYAIMRWAKSHYTNFYIKRVLLTLPSVSSEERLEYTKILWEKISEFIPPGLFEPEEFMLMTLELEQMVMTYAKYVEGARQAWERIRG